MVATAPLTDAVRRILFDGDFIVISAEQNELPPEANSDRMRILRRFLESGGYDTYPTVGSYKGHVEHSFFVPHLDKESAVMLARMFHQECVLVGNVGLVFTDGSVFPDNGLMTMNGAEDDDYTIILLTGGEQFKFTIGIDVPESAFDLIKEEVAA